MSKTSDKVASSATKDVKVDLVVEVGQPIVKEGKNGKILWIGVLDDVKNVKVMWDDGSVQIFTNKDLQ